MSFEKTKLELVELPKGWWGDVRKEAAKSFEELPMPGAKMETWRFSNHAGVKLDGVKLKDAGVTSGGILSGEKVAEVFAEGKAAELPAELKKKGVVFCSLEEALEKHEELVKAYFQKLPANLGSEKFVALNTALSRNGALLFVPKGVEVPEVFVLRHELKGDGTAAFPHTLMILEEGAKATLWESFVSVGGVAEKQFVSGVNDLHAGLGARLGYVGFQDWSRETLGFQVNSIVAEKDAEVRSLNVHVGGRQMRHESHSRLLGAGANSEMFSLTVADGKQEFDQRTLQTHAAGGATSNLLYKNALKEKARTIFSGLIIVEPDAQKTDAYQSNRNLMLSGDAEAHSLPGLEIQANDVRCTHGATTSRVDPEQEFYLQARGLKRQQAEELLVLGFFEEVLEKVEAPAVRAQLEEAIRGKILCR